MWEKCEIDGMRKSEERIFERVRGSDNVRLRNRATKRQEGCRDGEIMRKSKWKKMREWESNKTDLQREWEKEKRRDRDKNMLRVI